MAEIGRYNELRVVSKNDIGLVLTDGGEPVLLPYQHVPKDTQIGDHLYLFVFLNKDGRLQATGQRPYACVGDFALLKVVDVTDDGAYMDLGIEKDIFVPNREQKRAMFKGDKHVVYVFLDDQNDKMVASSKLADFVEDTDIELEEGDEVSLLICDRTDLGYNAIINNKYIGLLYHNELFAGIEMGDLRKGWIKKIRVGNKIDVSLQPMGYGHILDTKDILLEALKAEGTIALGDKSEPADIYERFQISKSAFKKTIGALYKERKITLSDHEIRYIVED